MKPESLPNQRAKGRPKRCRASYNVTQQQFYCGTSSVDLATNFCFTPMTLVLLFFCTCFHDFLMRKYFCASCLQVDRYNSNRTNGHHVAIHGWRQTRRSLCGPTAAAKQGISAEGVCQQLEPILQNTVVGHTVKGCAFLAGCRCDKRRGSSPDPASAARPILKESFNIDLIGTMIQSPLITTQGKCIFCRR